MTWFDSKNNPPPQGTKVLCFDEGDLWVAQRFREYWFPIPFCDSRLAQYKAPELWQSVNFPDGYKGKIMFQLEGEDDLMDVEAIEKENPEFLTRLIECMKKQMDDRQEKHPND